MAKAVSKKLSELTEQQKLNLILRIDRNTGYGLLTAGRALRGEFGDLDVVDMLKRFDMTTHQAKIHARKAINLIQVQI
jgi:hypothetical protein